eukprot:5524570-Pyramimonas_sp.AAC.1
MVTLRALTVGDLTGAYGDLTGWDAPHGEALLLEVEEAVPQLTHAEARVAEVDREGGGPRQVQQRLADLCDGSQSHVRN